jgi:hypothetical protein
MGRAIRAPALALPRRVKGHSRAHTMDETLCSRNTFDNTHKPLEHRRETFKSAHGIKKLSANPIASPHGDRISARNKLIRWRKDCHCRRGSNTDLDLCLARYHASHGYCVRQRCSREPNRKQMVGALQSHAGPIEASIGSHFSALGMLRCRKRLGRSTGVLHQEAWMPNNNHVVRYANWKTSTEAIVAEAARSASAKRAMSSNWFVMYVPR